MVGGGKLGSSGIRGICDGGEGGDGFGFFLEMREERDFIFLRMKSIIGLLWWWWCVMSLMWERVVRGNKVCGEV